MDKLFENKGMVRLRSFAEKLAASKYLGAISGGLMSTMALIMVGALCQILASLPFGQNVKDILLVPYNMTLNLMSVTASFSIAYVLARSFKMKALQAGVVSMSLFLMVAAPVQTVVLEDGSTFTGLSSGSLGGTGLFTAIIIGLVSVRITKLCQDKKFVIRMPDVVPPTLGDSFSSIIPLAINVILFYGLNVALQSFLGLTLPNAIIAVLAIPLQALTSGAGIIVIALFMLILWIFGIHGTMVGIAVLLPMYMQAILGNAELVAAGQAPVFQPVLLAFTIASVGGTGCTLGMAIMGLRSKSEQIRAVCRAGIVPGLFGINEPLTFGLPIVYNPILAIPYILGSILVMLLTWGGYAIGFLKVPYIYMMSLLPMGVSGFLSTLSWTNAIWPYLMIPVVMIVWYPFYKVYERQLVEKEQAAKAEAGAAGEKA